MLFISTFHSRFAQVAYKETSPHTHNLQQFWAIQGLKMASPKFKYLTRRVSTLAMISILSIVSVKVVIPALVNDKQPLVMVSDPKIRKRTTLGPFVTAKDTIKSTEMIRVRQPASEVIHPLLKGRVISNKLRPSDCKGCFLYTYKPMLRPRVCSVKENVTLLVVITTIHNEAMVRDRVRQSWLRFSHNNSSPRMRHVFLLGDNGNNTQQEALMDENWKYGDILQDDFKESYYNLSIKVLMAYKWANTQCPMVRFILRTATDNYVNVPGLIDYIDKRSPSLENVQLGRVLGGQPVDRQKSSKYYLSYAEYPHPVFPPYSIGTAFVVSMTTARRILDISRDIPYFTLEDVYFGMCLRKLGLYVMNNNRFNGSWRRVRQSKGICQLYSIHEVPAAAMVPLYKRCHERFLKDFA